MRQEFRVILIKALFFSIVLCIRLSFLFAQEQEPDLQDIFVSGQDGYPAYRIPSILMTSGGILVAVCEGRKSLDDHAENDLVMRRSNDRGQTWGPLEVLADHGKDALNNPTLFEDRKAGKLFLMFQEYPEAHGERGVAPGYRGTNICRTYVMLSRDDGATWSDPSEITRQVKRRKEVTSTACGPGIGIQVTRGKYRDRLVVPFNQGPWGSWKVYTVYSDNGGKSWHRGQTAPESSPGRGNEVQIAEREDGSLLLNARSFSGRHFRKKSFSRDGGKTWDPLVDDPGLPEPGCQGSLLRFSFTGNEPGRILYCGPADTTTRRSGTLRVSYDDGKTWPAALIIYSGSFAYSCLVRLDEKTVGVLFERDHYSRISLSRISINDIEKQTKSTLHDQI